MAIFDGDNNYTYQTGSAFAYAEWGVGVPISPTYQLTAVATADVVLSPDGSLLYAAGDDGNIRVYNMASGTLLATWDVGIDLGGMDISPDGSFIIVVEDQELSQSSSQWDTVTSVTSYRIETATGQVTSFPTTTTGYDGPFYDVAILANGTALLSGTFYGSGWTPLWVLDPNTGVYTSSGSARQSTTLTRSSDGSLVLVAEANISDAALDLYQSGIGIVKSHNWYADGVSGFNGGVEAYSLEANLAIQLGSVVYDAQLNYLFRLTDVLPEASVSALAFDAAGDNLYILDPHSDSILQVSLADWTIVRTFEAGFDVQSSWWANYGHELLVAPDASYFSIRAEDGIHIVTADAVRVQWEGGTGVDYLIGGQGSNLMNGYASDDSIWGEAGADVLNGGQGNDLLNGGTGADQMAGGTENDTYVVDNAGDVVTELTGEGTDTVQTTLGTGAGIPARVANEYVLPDNVENLTGTLNTGQGLRGNDLANVITAGGGADFIDVQDGGSDIVNSGDGRDVIYYGGAMDSGDANNGGDEGGDARGDLLVLQGDYSGGLTLGDGALVDVEKLRLLKGVNDSFGYEGGGTFSYDIISVDANVAAGARVVIQGGSLQLGEHLTFDGSAESNGSFQIFGGHDSDTLIGGAQGDHLLGRNGDDHLVGNGGNDRFRGGLGADLMEGGVGADTFVYAAQAGAEGYPSAVLESTGTGYDTIIGFNFFGEDKIDLPQSVSSLASTSTGALNDASFNSDLAAAVDGSLAANGAVLFTASAGDHSGDLFLVVDADGNGSYQANLDYVIHLESSLNLNSANVALFI